MNNNSQHFIMSQVDYARFKAAQLRVKLQERGIPDPGLLKSALIAALEHADYDAANQTKAPRSAPLAQAAEVMNTARVRKDRLNAQPKITAAPPSRYSKSQHLGSGSSSLQIIGTSAVSVVGIIVGIAIFAALVSWTMSGKGHVKVTVVESAKGEATSLPWVCYGCKQKGGRFVDGEPVLEWCTKEECE